MLSRSRALLYRPDRPGTRCPEQRVSTPNGGLFRCLVAVRLWDWAAGRPGRGPLDGGVTFRGLVSSEERCRDHGESRDREGDHECVSAEGDDCAFSVHLEAIVGWGHPDDSRAWSFGRASRHRPNPTFAKSRFAPAGRRMPTRYTFRPTSRVEVWAMPMRTRGHACRRSRYSCRARPMPRGRTVPAGCRSTAS